MNTSILIISSSFSLSAWTTFSFNLQFYTYHTLYTTTVLQTTSIHRRRISQGLVLILNNMFCLLFWFTTVPPLNAHSRSALCRSFYDIKRCKSWYTQDIIFFWQEVAQMNIQIMILLVPTLVKHLVFLYKAKKANRECL